MLQIVDYASVFVATMPDEILDHRFVNVELALLLHIAMLVLTKS